MVWHNETVVGVDATIEALNRLLPRLEPFQCIVIQPREGMKFMLFRKPWIGILVSGRLSRGEAAQLHVVGERLRLSASGSTPSEDGARGFAFCYPNEGSNMALDCRQFLDVFCNISSVITIHGVNATVNTFPPNIGQDNP